VPSINFSPKRLRAQRRARGLSRTELAAAICVSHETVALWEAGRNTPRIDALPRLCAALACAMEDLFGPRSELDTDDDPADRRGRLTTASGRTHDAA
jgi:transcriptional regulator with XRE-family HTH domain